MHQCRWLNFVQLHLYPLCHTLMLEHWTFWHAMLMLAFPVRYFDHTSVDSCIQGLNEATFTEADVVAANLNLGLILLRAKHHEALEFVKFSEESEHVAGPHVYCVVFPNRCSSPMLLRGHLAYQCKHDKDPHLASYPKDRTSAYVFKGIEGIELPASGASLLQIASLGASRELDIIHNNLSNNFGFHEGYGAPVFKSIGRLVGVVSYQEAGFDFAIQVESLIKFVSNYFSTQIPTEVVDSSTAALDISSAPDGLREAPHGTVAFIQQPRFTRGVVRRKRFILATNIKNPI
ncbi:uncharacterized protein LOC126666648 isoform X2 [Mercurialis annua]|uniref:uncharacterized protein LOC126666648 isoform X2 n=1 Tax=Mercurialis annua TaxID=3986 RepID=UPI00215F0CBE|nr:uncharacterized protein LOC126666648 isoform X2 [Mercurialis annua]